MGVKTNAETGGISKAKLYEATENSGFVTSDMTANEMLDALSDYFTDTTYEAIKVGSYVANSSAQPYHQDIVRWDTALAHPYGDARVGMTNSIMTVYCVLLQRIKSLYVSGYVTVTVNNGSQSETYNAPCTIDMSEYPPQTAITIRNRQSANTIFDNGVIIHGWQY